MTTVGAVPWLLNYNVPLASASLQQGETGGTFLLGRGIGIEAEQGGQCRAGPERGDRRGVRLQPVVSVTGGGIGAWQSRTLPFTLHSQSSGQGGQ